MRPSPPPKIWQKKYSPPKRHTGTYSRYTGEIRGGSIFLTRHMERRWEAFPDDESGLSTTSCQRNRHAVDERKTTGVDLLDERRKTLGGHSGRFLFKRKQKQNCQTSYFLQVMNIEIQSTSNLLQMIS